MYRQHRRAEHADFNDWVDFSRRFRGTPRREATRPQANGTFETEVLEN